MVDRPRVALVLSGGAARGAYEAGVVAWLREEMPRETGVHARFDILVGSSVGALNACFLAATAHRPEEQGQRLVELWSNLELDQILPLRTGDVMRFGRALLGVWPSAAEVHKKSGIVDPGPLEELVARICPWPFITRNLERGAFEALAVSATHVVSGHTVIFVQRADGTVPEWSRDPFVHAMPAHLRLQHALASGAIPVLFPAVSIDGHYYCDGALRQSTPISPALRLGADRVLAISLRYRPEGDVSNPAAALPDRSAEVPGPFFLFGKFINALWLDHLDYDVDRMRRTNALIEAGTRAYGPEFLARINEALRGMDHATLRPVRELRIHPSRDIGTMAAEIVRSPDFAARSRGLAATVLRRAAGDKPAADGKGDSDLMSYLLFDGEYCRALIELGRADAAARKDELARFFDGG